MTDPAILTLRDQAHLIDALVARCVMRDGEVAGEAVLVLDETTVGQLHHLAMRLERMAPYQNDIEKLVRYGRG